MRQVQEAVGDELIAGYRRFRLGRNDVAQVASFLNRIQIAGSPKIWRAPFRLRLTCVYTTLGV